MYYCNAQDVPKKNRSKICISQKNVVYLHRQTLIQFVMIKFICNVIVGGVGLAVIYLPRIIISIVRYIIVKGRNKIWEKNIYENNDLFCKRYGIPAEGKCVKTKIPRTVIRRKLKKQY